MERRVIGEVLRDREVEVERRHLEHDAELREGAERSTPLVGAYTGLVFQGPGLLRRLRDGVAARLRADGLGSLTELRAAHRPPGHS
jgi:hypothetical protein